MVSLAVGSFLLALMVPYVRCLPLCADAGDGEYDYIVVGSGAGGGPVATRLAEAGYAVLVVDVGHDIHTINTTIPLYAIRAVEDPQLELAYTLDEYPPNFKYTKNDAWYPRAGALGGSTIHNAMINILAETRSDFDGLATMFDDPTWSRDNMQEYFKKIEHADYPVVAVQDHGFDGWLHTNVNPLLAVLDPEFIDLQILDFATSISTSAPLVVDLNSRAGDDATGLSFPSFTFLVTSNYSRSSIRDRLVDVQQKESDTGGGSLIFQLDTLATKILTCTDTTGNPRAFGVEVAPGATLPVSLNFSGKTDLKTKVITARREVILSAGTFQSPQLLMLSGIGDSSQLQKFSIEPVVHLPGVGLNMQDHDEIAVIWKLKQNFSIADGCTVLFDPKDDPCLAEYISGKTNLYSFGAALAAITAKSREEYPEPDMLTYWIPAYFPGFVHGFGQEAADHKDSVTAVHLKAHPSSRGTVRLTGSHPQDLLDIQKNHFQDPVNGQRDVEDLRNAIKRSREVMNGLPVVLHVDEEVFPGADFATDEQIDDHIFRNIFGHHICCTNAMGPDDDELAVLDGDFRVRGVAGLRVVDASSWPTVPGYFVTTPFYMGAEKAADSIIADAR